jgi:flagellar basal-body rod protein FlgB
MPKLPINIMKFREEKPMFSDSLSIETINLLKKGLDAAALRHRVISNNIANINTPGFKRSSVVFGKELAKASKSRFVAKRFHPKHIPFGRKDEFYPKIVVEENTVYRNDKNNVDLNQEMADLAKNTLYYNALATRISSKFRSILSVIQGGVR